MCCCSYGWELDWPCLQAALSNLDKERRRPNFGNAGAINNLLSDAAMRMEARTKHLTPAEQADAQPEPADFMTEADAAAAAAGGAATAANVFADLIGCQSVLEKVKEWQATITASQRLGKDPLESFELNFLFVGSPGELPLRRVFCMLMTWQEDTGPGSCGGLLELMSPTAAACTAVGAWQLVPCFLATCLPVIASKSSYTGMLHWQAQGKHCLLSALGMTVAWCSQPARAAPGATSLQVRARPQLQGEWAACSSSWASSPRTRWWSAQQETL